MRMESDVTFLIPHAESAYMLDAALHSIRQFHGEKIIVSQHEADHFNRNIEWMAARYNADYIYHGGWFGDACLSLFNACESKYAVYLESDVILLDSVYPMIESVRIQDFLGVEEVIPLKDGLTLHGIGPDKKYLRYAPNYYTHSFFLINMERFKDQAGTAGIWVDQQQALREFGGWNPVEPSHGISQIVRKWPKKNLACRFTEYGAGTVYDSSVFHMWFGGWRFRDTAAMGFEQTWMMDVELEILKDYWSGRFNP